MNFKIWISNKFMNKLNNNPRLFKMIGDYIISL